MLQDALSRPRVAELAEALCECATDFAIPRSEIQAAFADYARTGSTAAISRLSNKATSLFTELQNTGEGGELLLFVLSETYLRLPQVMCKMSLKTNTNMHVHGADGVHAGVDDVTGRLCLYWGESKIYASPTDAIRECLASLAPLLTQHGPSAASNRDLQLLQRAADLADPQLETELKRFLDPRDPLHNALEIRGICLVGFDCDAYSSASAQRTNEEVVAAIASMMPAWKTHVGNRVTAESLIAFSIHFMCVPVPSAAEFRAAMLTALGAPSGSS